MAKKGRMEGKPPLAMTLTSLLTGAIGACAVALAPVYAMLYNHRDVPGWTYHVLCVPLIGGIAALIFRRWALGAGLVLGWLVAASTLVLQCVLAVP
jgi:hypothetical protein